MRENVVQLVREKGGALHLGSLLRTIFFGRFRWWSRALLLATAYWVLVLTQWPNSATAVDALNSAAVLIFKYIKLIVLGSLLLATAIVLRIRAQNRALALGGRFENQPWLFDNELVQLTVKVEYILPNTKAEVFKRRATHVRRSLTGNTDRKNRHVHLRFLGSSPFLKRGERLLVVHNLDRDQTTVRKGQYVVVQGVYVHRPSPKKKFLWFKGYHYYGLLHYTHAPRGFIRKASRGEMIRPFTPKSEKSRQERRAANY